MIKLIIIEKSDHFRMRLIFVTLFLFLLALYPVDKVYSSEVQGWEASKSAKLEYWIDTFSLTIDEFNKIVIDKTYFRDEEIFPFIKPEVIYGFYFSGSIQLFDKNSLIRIILIDINNNEFLVYEAYPLIVTTNYFSLEDSGEETCLLESVKPRSLRIETIQASVEIKEISFLNTHPGEDRHIPMLQEKIKITQNAVKIAQINDQIEKKGLKWVAGETSVSQLSYSDKKKLFGRKKLPNLQGAEYYKGGVFEIKPTSDSQSLQNNGGSSLIESFDWRNRHGANNPDSPYYDGDPTGSGWVTPVKSQGCNHCWAFSPLHATESLVNLYYNQHLDLDLSEQDVGSCSGGDIGCCDGGYINTALNYIIDIGVVDEACFPYSSSCESCANKCSNPSDRITISGSLYPGYNEEDIKRAIIDYGPITGGISSWWHFMVMVGFDKDPVDGETIWIFKNSWGTGWGDNGYGYLKVELNDLYGKNALLTPLSSLISYDIACNDMDGDGYYNWGISADKPTACPDGPSEKDCDDSKSSLGPFDSNGYCTMLGYGDELAMDFGGLGLWDYDGMAWTPISSSSPEVMTGWSGGLAMDFSNVGSGLWNFDGTTWTQVSGSDVEVMADWADGLAMDFGPLGLWNYDGTTWTQISGSDVEVMTGWANGLAMDFGGLGLWNYDGTTWTQISSSDVEILADWVDGLAMDFGALGLWNYDGTTWTQLSSSSPEGMAGWPGGLAMDFGALGLWNYDGTTWTQISGSDVEVMTGWANGLAMDFGGLGLWNFSGTTWTQLSSSDVEEMDDVDLF